MNRQNFIILFLLATAVYLIGLPVDIMGVDSPQYAAISREMSESGQFLHVTQGGQDYLDKPPLLFWVNALFFEIFGYSNWVFKLGSFLFTLLGVFSTFKVGSLLYSDRVGRLAAIILYTCQAFFLFNHDVRTDTMLTGSVIFAIWQLLAWLHSYQWKWLISASVGIALAMLAKGPVGLMVPVLAIGAYLVGTGRWRDFFRWQYLVLVLIVAILLAPMLYGLYTQFDQHPEKTVGMVTSEGKKYVKNVSGLKFYLWTQSFGRITGENAWKNNAGAFYFVHNLLWSFLPWALMFVMAFFTRLVRVLKSATSGQQMPELLTIGGFILPFIIMSMSSYKLPHYIFILYPLAAILMASWWDDYVWGEKGVLRRTFNAAVIMQALVALASIGMVILIYFRFFPGAAIWKFIISGLLLLAGILYLFRSRKRAANIIIASAMLSLGVNFTMNAHYYPRLLKFQAGSQLAYRIHDRSIEPSDVFMYHFHNFSFMYYLGDTKVQSATDELLKKRLDAGKTSYLVTSDPYLEDIRRDFEVEVLEEIGSHSVTLVDMKFLSADTRESQLEPVYLLKIKDLR